MGSSYRGLRRVASFRPYTSKQVGDTGPAESARQRNSRAFGSSFSGARETRSIPKFRFLFSHLFKVKPVDLMAGSDKEKVTGGCVVGHVPSKLEPSQTNKKTI